MLSWRNKKKYGVLSGAGALPGAMIWNIIHIGVLT